MKVISYSVFRNPSATEWEYRAYVRGMCFNIRMNKLLYPGWETQVRVDYETEDKFGLLFKSLGASVFLSNAESICRSMLHRMIPVFHDNITHVLCRDADAITTYREACSVNDWLNSGKAVHGINDNPAHSIPLMGGMIGIDCAKFRNIFCSKDALNLVMDKTDFERLIEGYDLTERGSDQRLLMERVWPEVQHDFFLSKDPIQKRDNPLWESDLTCRHIGSAGVIDLEVLRFFRRFDSANQPMYDEIEKQYPEIFYWTL